MLYVIEYAKWNGGLYAPYMKSEFIPYCSKDMDLLVNQCDDMNNSQNKAYIDHYRVVPYGPMDLVNTGANVYSGEGGKRAGGGSSESIQSVDPPKAPIKIVEPTEAERRGIMGGGDQPIDPKRPNPPDEGSAPRDPLTVEETKAMFDAKDKATDMAPQDPPVIGFDIAPPKPGPDTDADGQPNPPNPDDDQPSHFTEKDVAAEQHGESTPESAIPATQPGAETVSDPPPSDPTPGENPQQGGDQDDVAPGS